MNLHWSIPATLVVMLAGCSSSSDNEPLGNDSASNNNASPNSSEVPATVRYFGLAGASTFFRQENIEFFAVFGEYSEEVSVDALLSTFSSLNIYLEAPPTAPVCTIEALADFEIPEDPFANVPAEFVSAGDNLIVTSAEGTVADFGKIEDGIPAIYYGNETDLLYFPPNIQLDIPGDVFPAMTVPFPTVAKLNQSDAPLFREARLDEEFMWTPTGDASAVIELSFSDDSEETDVTCYSADNGVFEFPQSVIDHFGVEQPMIMQTISRAKSIIHYTDSAILITSFSTEI